MSWVVERGVLGPGSWILGLGSLVLGPGSWVLIQDYAFCDVFIHRFTANDYVMFQAIWNEYRGVKKHSDFLMNNNLRKRSINNKLFIHSVKIHKDFFKLIYHSYGLWITRKDESRGIKELLENTCLKVTGTKKELVSRAFTASENGVQPVKTAIEIESDLITDYKNKLKIDDFPKLD